MPAIAAALPPEGRPHPELLAAVPAIAVALPPEGRPRPRGSPPYRRPWCPQGSRLRGALVNVAAGSPASRGSSQMVGARSVLVRSCCRHPSRRFAPSRPRAPSAPSSRYNLVAAHRCALSMNPPPRPPRAAARRPAPPRAGRDGQEIPRAGREARRAASSALRAAPSDRWAVLSIRRAVPSARWAIPSARPVLSSVPSRPGSSPSVSWALWSESEHLPRSSRLVRSCGAHGYGPASW